MMKLFYSIITALFFLSCNLPPPKQQTVSAVTKTNCMICHDHSEMQRGPVINGLQADYMLQQIQKFKKRVRGGHNFDHQGALMYSAVEKLDDELIALSVGEISQLTPKKYIRTVRGDLQKGKVIYQQKCITCHGEKAEGIKELFTGNMAILEDWYLLGQLRNYKYGKRGYDDGDIQGKLMAIQIKDLTDQDFKNLVKFIGSINNSTH